MPATSSYPDRTIRLYCILYMFAVTDAIGQCTVLLRCERPLPCSDCTMSYSISSTVALLAYYSEEQDSIGMARSVSGAQLTDS